MNDARLQAASYAVLIKPVVHENTQNLSSYSLWFKDVHSLSNIHLREKFFSHSSGPRTTRTYIFGCDHNQWLSWQTSNLSIYSSGRNDSSTLTECLQFRIPNSILTLHTLQEKSTPQHVLYLVYKKDPNEKVFRKIREDDPTKPVEVNIETAGIVHEERFFWQHRPRWDHTKKFWKRKQETRKAIPNDPPVITVTCYYAIDLHKDTTFVNIAQLAGPSRIFIEQDSDLTLKSSNANCCAYLLTNKFSKMMHATCLIPESKSVESSKMIYSADNTIMILVKSVTYKCFYPDNY